MGLWIQRISWKKGVADGTYFVYYIEGATDTVSYKVYKVKGSHIKGEVLCYKYNSGPEYKKGDLMEKVLYRADTVPVYFERYDYMDYDSATVWSERPYFSFWDLKVISVNKPGDIIVHRTEYDSVGEAIFHNISVVRSDTLLVLYENRGQSEWEEGYFCRYYHLKKTSRIFLEATTKDSVLTEKRWCPTGELYYHTITQLAYYDGGSKGYGSQNVIIDHRSSKHLNEAFFFFHCQ